MQWFKTKNGYVNLELVQEIQPYVYKEKTSLVLRFGTLAGVINDRLQHIPIQVSIDDPEDMERLENLLNRPNRDKAFGSSLP